MTEPAMTGSGAATAVIALCSSARLAHLRRQLAASGRDGRIDRIVIWLEEGPPPALPGVAVHVLPAGAGGFRLAAARNLGARLAIERGAELLVFLDADCIPGPGLLPRYREVAGTRPGAVYCGPVTYLPAGSSVATDDDLIRATDPHPARPAPPAGTEVIAAEQDYRLFWSLSFALEAQTWCRSGGFDEAYQGYGAEDTDFAWRLRAAGIPLVWVGGADAYHQYHPTSTPPWQHLVDIVRNAGLFFDRWSEWPMQGWLTAFVEAGAVEFAEGAYRIVDGPGTSRDPAIRR